MCAGLGARAGALDKRGRHVIVAMDMKRRKVGDGIERRLCRDEGRYSYLNGCRLCSFGRNLYIGVTP